MTAPRSAPLPVPPPTLSLHSRVMRPRSARPRTRSGLAASEAARRSTASPNMVFNPAAAAATRGWTPLSRARFRPHLSATPPPGARLNFVAATGPGQWACMAQAVSLSAFTRAPGDLRVEASARFRSAAPASPCAPPSPPLFQFAAVLYDGTCNVLAQHVTPETPAPHDRWMRVRHAFDPHPAARFVLLVVSGQGAAPDPRVLRGVRVAAISARLLCDLTTAAGDSHAAALLPEAFSNLGPLTIGPPRVVRAYVDAQRADHATIPDHIRRRLTTAVMDPPSAPGTPRRPTSPSARPTPSSQSRDENVLLRDPSLDPAAAAVSFPPDMAQHRDADHDNDNDDDDEVHPPSSYNATDVDDSDNERAAAAEAALLVKPGAPPPPPPDPLRMRTATDEVVNFGYWSAIPAASADSGPRFHPAGQLDTADDVFGASSPADSRDDVATPPPLSSSRTDPPSSERAVASRGRSWRRRQAMAQQLSSPSPPPPPRTLKHLVLSATASAEMPLPSLPPQRPPPLEDIASPFESREDVTKLQNALGNGIFIVPGSIDQDSTTNANNSNAMGEKAGETPQTPRRRKLAKAAAVAAMTRLRSLKSTRSKRDFGRSSTARVDVVPEDQQPSAGPSSPEPAVLTRAKSAQADLSSGEVRGAPATPALRVPSLWSPRGSANKVSTVPDSPVTPHVKDDTAGIGIGDDVLVDEVDVVTLGTEEDVALHNVDGEMPPLHEPRSSDAGSAVRSPEVDFRTTKDSTDTIQSESGKQDGEAIAEERVADDGGDDNLGDEEAVMRWLALLKTTLGSVPDARIISPNLVSNPSGKDGLAGWKNLSPDYWSTEVSAQPCCDNRFNFVAKRPGCSMVQPVDLARFIRNPGRVGIEVSARFRSRPGAPAVFRLRAALYNVDGKELLFRDTKDILAPDDHWELISVEFPPTPRARFTLIYVSGIDVKGVRFGTKVVQCSVRAVQSVSAGNLECLLPPQVPPPLSEDVCGQMRRVLSAYCRRIGASEVLSRERSFSVDSEGDDGWCGDTTSRTSSVGELGRLFIGRYAGLRVVSPNLLHNPYAESGLSGWTNLGKNDDKTSSARTGWVTEQAGVPLDTRCTNFVSKRASCALAQPVDLARFLVNPATAALAVTVQFRARNDAATHGALCVRAIVLDAHNHPLEAFESGEMEPARGRWSTVQFDLPPVGRARFVIIVLAARGPRGVRVAEVALRATCDPLYGARRNILVPADASGVSAANVAPATVLRALQTNGIVCSKVNSTSIGASTVRRARCSEDSSLIGPTRTGVQTGGGAGHEQYAKSKDQPGSNTHSTITKSTNEDGDIDDNDEVVVRIESESQIEELEVVDLCSDDVEESVEGPRRSIHKVGKRDKRDEEAISEASSFFERVNTNSLGGAEAGADRAGEELGAVTGAKMSAKGNGKNDGSNGMEEWFGPFSRRRSSSGDMLYNGAGTLGVRGWTPLVRQAEAQWQAGITLVNGSHKACFTAAQTARSAMGQGIEISKFVRSDGGVSYLISAKFRNNGATGGSGNKGKQQFRLVAGLLDGNGGEARVFDSGKLRARADGRWTSVKHVFAPSTGAQYVVVLAEGSGGVMMRGCCVSAMYYGRHDGAQTVVEERFGALQEDDVVPRAVVVRFARRYLGDVALGVQESAAEEKESGGAGKEQAGSTRSAAEAEAALGNLVVNADGADGLRAWVHMSEGTWQAGAAAEGGSGFEATRRWCAMCQAVDLERARARATGGAAARCVPSERAFVEVSARVLGSSNSSDINGGGRFRLEAALLDRRLRELKRVRADNLPAAASPAGGAPVRLVCEPVRGARYAAVIASGRSGNGAPVRVRDVCVRVFDGDPDSGGVAATPAPGAVPRGDGRAVTERAVRQLFSSGLPS